MGVNGVWGGFLRGEGWSFFSNVNTAFLEIDNAFGRTCCPQNDSSRKSHRLGRIAHERGAWTIAKSAEGLRSPFALRVTTGLNGPTDAQMSLLVIVLIVVVAVAWCVLR